VPNFMSRVLSLQPTVLSQEVNTRDNNSNPICPLFPDKTSQLSSLR
jgi:hypothetical protein